MAFFPHRDRFSRTTLTHIERCLITKNSFIQPLTYGGDCLSESLENEGKILYSTNLEKVLDESVDTIPFPQAGEKECGTLTLMYLKELLKNDAEQLKNFTMRFLISDKEGFFFPSPHVLRYSQSSFYNKSIVAMLEDSDYAEFTHNNETIRIKTLKQLLIESKDRLQNSNSMEHDNCQVLLEALPSFRQSWMTAYEDTAQKRELMDAQIVGKNKNGYLAYTNERMKRKIIERNKDPIQSERVPTDKTIDLNSNTLQVQPDDLAVAPATPPILSEITSSIPTEPQSIEFVVSSVGQLETKREHRPNRISSILRANLASWVSEAYFSGCNPPQNNEKLMGIVTQLGTKEKYQLLLDILIINIQDKKSNRWTTFNSDTKLTEFKKLRENLAQSEDAFDSSELMSHIKQICQIKRNPLSFFQQPHSVKELQTLKRLMQIDEGNCMQPTQTMDI